MIDNDPIATAGRRRRRQKRFLIDNPTCLLCGEPNLECLTPVTLDWLKAHRVLIEMHHAASEQNDPEFVVPVCLNCHRKVTEGLAQAGVSMRRESNPKTRVAVMLEALAVFLSMLADAVRRWAALLRQSTPLEAPCE
jgi:hypothetical protein